MITRLIIKNASNSFSLTSGIIQVLSSDSYFIVQADEERNSITFGADVSLSTSGSSYPYVKTINDLPAAPWDNNFYFLGSECTSVIGVSQSFYSDSQFSSSTSAYIGIFDGCLPCNNCDTLAQLQRSVQECQIWINGLKDCNLYYEDTAFNLWEKMKNKVVQQSANCNIGFSDQITNRQQSLRRATKLLYQYKALVAMWNYLVRTKQGFVHIQTAPQDWAGFIVGSKRSITHCSDSSIKNAALTIKVTLQSGQDISYLDSATYAGKAAPQNIHYYVGKTDQNTYIEYGGDKGKGTGQNTGISDSYSLWFARTPDSSPQVVITARFRFYVNKGDNTTLSGAVKVLQCISLRSDSTDPVAELVTLEDWADLRGQADALSTGGATASNLWRIESWWDFDSQISNSGVFYEDRYFTTPYSKIGTPESDSLSE